MTAAGRAVASAGYAPANGLQVYYEIHGAGEPLVLLHGAMGTIQSCFGGLLPALARSRQVIALELQGHGHTADTDRPLSYEQLADDVVAVVGGRGVDRTDFVGYSMGGAVAIQTAMRHPGIVRRVVYAGGASYTASGLHPAALQAITATTPDDLHGSVWQQAYLTVAPRPSAWATLVAKANALDRSFTGWTSARRGEHPTSGASQRNQAWRRIQKRDPKQPVPDDDRSTDSPCRRCCGRAPRGLRNARQRRRGLAVARRQQRHRRP